MFYGFKEIFFGAVYGLEMTFCEGFRVSALLLTPRLWGLELGCTLTLNYAP